MMRTVKILASALLVTFVVSVCIDYTASAATGHSFILGKINKANRITKLKRTTAGAALSLHTTSSAAAPMLVNGHGKVTNLNADTLDGQDSSALATTTYSWTSAVTAPSSSVNLLIPLPAGTYVVGYDAAMPFGATTGQSGGCYVDRYRSGAYTIYADDWSATVTGQAMAASGSAVVSVAPGDTVHLFCYAPHTFTTNAGEPFHIYAVRTRLAPTSSLRVVPGQRVVAR